MDFNMDWSELSLPEMDFCNKASAGGAVLPLEIPMMEEDAPLRCLVVSAAPHRRFSDQVQVVPGSGYGHASECVSPTPTWQQDPHTRFSLDSLHEVPHSPTPGFFGTVAAATATASTFQQQLATFNQLTHHLSSDPPPQHRLSAPAPSSFAGMNTPEPYQQRSASFSVGDTPAAYRPRSNAMSSNGSPPAAHPMQAASPWWTEDMLDMSSTDLNHLVDQMQLPDQLVDQLKLARRRKKNRMYAKRSRQRRQSGGDPSRSARMQCKIDALTAANNRLRGNVSSG